MSGKIAFSENDVEFRVCYTAYRVCEGVDYHRPGYEDAATIRTQVRKLLARLEGNLLKDREVEGLLTPTDREAVEQVISRGNDWMVGTSVDLGLKASKEFLSALEKPVANILAILVGRIICNLL